MTLHTSKGLEFPFVWILNVRYGCIPHKLNPKIAEERRLLYVGMTRAQCSLVLAFNHEKLGYYDDSDAFWSPFVGVLLQKREDVRVESRGDTLMVRMKVDDFVHIAKQLRRTFDVAELKKKSMDLEDLQKLQGFNEKSTGKDTNEGSYKHKGVKRSSTFSNSAFVSAKFLKRTTK
jgi:ATP-dependent exoDNAse (exonuclease V) beta subunit